MRCEFVGRLRRRATRAALGAATARIALAAGDSRTAAFCCTVALTPQSLSFKIKFRAQAIVCYASIVKFLFAKR